MSVIQASHRFQCCVVEGFELPVMSLEQLLREARLEDEIAQWRKQFEQPDFMRDQFRLLRPDDGSAL